jgi:hypothetical protein
VTVYFDKVIVMEDGDAVGPGDFGGPDLLIGPSASVNSAYGNLKLDKPWQFWTVFGPFLFDTLEVATQPLYKGSTYVLGHTNEANLLRLNAIPGSTLEIRVGASEMDRFVTGWTVAYEIDHVTTPKPGQSSAFTMIVTGSNQFGVNSSLDKVDLRVVGHVTTK